MAFRFVWPCLQMYLKQRLNALVITPYSAQAEGADVGDDVGESDDAITLPDADADADAVDDSQTKGACIRQEPSRAKLLASEARVMLLCPQTWAQAQVASRAEKRQRWKKTTRKPIS